MIDELDDFEKRKAKDFEVEIERLRRKEKVSKIEKPDLTKRRVYHLYPFDNTTKEDLVKENNAFMVKKENDKMAKLRLFNALLGIMNTTILPINTEFKKELKVYSRKWYIKNKWKSVIKEFSRQMKLLKRYGLSIESWSKENPFSIVPFSRKNSKKFIKAVKRDDLKSVLNLLEKDRFLVHCVDFVSKKKINKYRENKQLCIGPPKETAKRCFQP